MTGFDAYLSYSSTSASGAMKSHVVQPMLVGCMLVGLGTSTAYALPMDTVLQPQHPVAQTTAGTPVSVSERAGAAIGELRRLSGFTWDQLARLFNVSRRSVHFWASGKPLTPSNEERLQRLLGVARKVDRGSASVNRAALLGVREDGSIPFDLLVDGEYERVTALLTAGELRRARPPKLSEKVRGARVPLPPEDLVGAHQDRIHPTSGRLLAARPIRVTGRK